MWGGDGENGGADVQKWCSFCWSIPSLLNLFPSNCISLVLCPAHVKRSRHCLMPIHRLAGVCSFYHLCLGKVSRDLGWPAATSPWWIHFGCPSNFRGNTSLVIRQACDFRIYIDSFSPNKADKQTQLHCRCCHICCHHRRHQTTGRGARSATNKL